jgi:excisionase family DNA binding protein
MDRDLLEVLTKPTVDPVLAGRVLGVGRSASYRAVRDGSLPSFMVGSQYRVPTEALLRRLGLDSTEARAAALQRLRHEHQADSRSGPARAA